MIGGSSSIKVLSYTTLLVGTVSFVLVLSIVVLISVFLITSSSLAFKFTSSFNTLPWLALNGLSVSVEVKLSTISVLFTLLSTSFHLVRSALVIWISVSELWLLKLVCVTYLPSASVFFKKSLSISFLV